MKQQKRHIDSWQFSQKWQIWENGELGKNPSKVGKTSIEVKREKSWQAAIIIRKWQIRRKKANFRKNGECAKNSSGVWPNIQMRWQKRASWPIAILQKWNIWQKCIEDLAQIEKRCQKRHVDTWGFYEMNILRNRWIWQGLRQWDNKTGKLTVGDFHKNGKFEKMGNWARIHQRSGKTSNEVTKRGILTKGKFRQIWRVC